MDPVVERARQGEEAAFHELFRSHRETVARIVIRTMGPGPEVEDVVQDVFVHVFRSIHKFRGDAKFTTWLYRLTVNVTRMHLRKKRSRPRFVDAPVPETQSPAAPRPLPLGPDEMVDRQSRVAALRRLVDALSEKKRTVLVLHDFDGRTAKEISVIVGAPVLTVRTRLFYARKELYAALADDPALGPVVTVLMGALPGRPRREAAPPTRRERQESGEATLAPPGARRRRQSVS
ncbi:MAG: sigma-70 family RNA polymerase sigma factor [Myxococcota bacterium]